MRTWSGIVVEDCPASRGWQRASRATLPPSHLHLVSAHDLKSLRDELARGNVPPDLEAKLSKLAVGKLGHRFIEHNCRTMIALLQAAQEGSFKQASLGACERLLRLLAYVRKDDDAIPDYRPDGFTDDQQEVRALATELSPLLQTFKEWRLLHQVPGMWLADLQRVKGAAQASGGLPCFHRSTVDELSQSFVRQMRAARFVG